MSDIGHPARWPAYLPYPHALTRWQGASSVPNQQSVDWPQAQFAPLYLRPGSPSFQPYSYDVQTGPYRDHEPHMFVETAPALIPRSQNFVPSGPDGDIAKLRDRPWDLAGPDCGCGPSHDCGCGGYAHDNPSEGVSVGKAVLGLVVVGAICWWAASLPLSVGIPSE